MRDIANGGTDGQTEIKTISDRHGNNMYEHYMLSQLHFFCFISNVYKQRFFQGVEILEKLSNSTPWNKSVKQQP